MGPNFIASQVRSQEVRFPSKRWGFGGLAGGMLAVATLHCSSFSASSPSDLDSSAPDGRTDATPNDPGDGGAGADAKVKETCAAKGDASFCEDFEGQAFPPYTLALRGSVGELDIIPDPATEGAALGNHVFRARGTNNTTFDEYLEANLNLPPSFEARFRIRAATAASSFNSTAYVLAMKLECNTARGFGVIFDSRGLTFQFNDNDGDFPGFTKDSLWHTVIVRITTTESSVTFDDGIVNRQARAFASRDCALRLGVSGSGSELPNVELDFDNVSIRAIP